MVDLGFIGKNGLIIQYEDIISLTGFNIVRYFKSKNVNKKLNDMSVNDILLSYFNRTDYDVSIWLKQEFNIDINIKDYIDSINTFQPNLLYSYKMFKASADNGITKLIVHSDFYSPVIEKFLSTYKIPIEYTYGDIVPVLQSRKNYTYTTSSPVNIKKCLMIDTPFAITIVDDYMYLGDLMNDNTVDELRKKDKYVNFTSVISGGIIG